MYFVVRWMTIYTPYGYGEVDMDKFQSQLEEDAKKSSEVHKAVLDYITEQELKIKLDIENKEKAEAEEKKKKEEEEKKKKEEEEAKIKAEEEAKKKAEEEKKKAEEEKK